jgi:hypothetical protein
MYKKTSCTMMAMGGAVKKMKAGGASHSDIKKDKPMMKKVAKAAVKGHEKRMHKGRG